MATSDLKFKKKSFKASFLLFGAALATVGVGYALVKKFEVFGDRTSRQLRNAIMGLNDRQKKILNMFEKDKQLMNSDIEKVITGVTRRTLRRDLTEMETLGIIKQHGKTKGSYYSLNLPKAVQKKK